MTKEEKKEMEETTERIYQKAKAELNKEKSGAVWVAMMELGDYINFSGIAKEYFKKSANWLLQRLHGYKVNGKPATFKPEEYQQLTTAFREIAAQLNAAADRIEAAQEENN